MIHSLPIFRLTLMVLCIVCGVDGPWKAGTSLTLHQKQCRKKVHLARIKQMAEAGNPANNDDDVSGIDPTTSPLPLTVYSVGNAG